jgi:lipoprotein-releasing system permease protein
MNPIIWIARRYFFSKRSGRFAPLLTATAIASVAVGMMALVIIMAVMLGFRNEMTERLIGFNSHVTIDRSPDADELIASEIDAVLHDIGVRDIVSYVQGEVIATSNIGGEQTAQGVRVRGVDIDNLGAMDRLDFIFPEWASDIGILGRVGSSGRPAAIIGREIVTQMGVHPDFRDSMFLIAPLANLGPSGELEPNRRRFDVAGLFDSGLYEYNSKYVIVSEDQARLLLGQQTKEGFLVRLDDAARVPRALTMLRAALPDGWSVSGMNETNKKLFAALKLERVAMGAVMLMALLIASLAIAGVVILQTSARRKDIAILSSVGLKRSSIIRIFLANAAMIGGAGAGIGLSVGLMVCFFMKWWPIRLPESYYLDFVPVRIDIPMAILFALIGVVVALVSSIIPVSRAASMNPVDVLRYE